MSTRRIAVFGGTFDPPHLGHLVVANEVRVAGGFDSVILMVANDPWQKSATRAISPAHVRLEMVRSAVQGRPGLVAGDQEIARGGATYTIDTIESLIAQDPAAEISMVVGADTAASLASWHRSEELSELVNLVTVGRPAVAPAQLDPRWRATHIEVPQLAISSTDLRSRVRDGRPIEFLVPDAVAHIVSGRGLYGCGS